MSLQMLLHAIFSKQIILNSHLIIHTGKKPYRRVQWLDFALFTEDKYI